MSQRCVLVQVIRSELERSYWNVFNCVATFYNAQKLIRSNIPKNLPAARNAIGSYLELKFTVVEEPTLIVGQCPLPRH